MTGAPHRSCMCICAAAAPRPDGFGCHRHHGRPLPRIRARGAAAQTGQGRLADTGRAGISHRLGPARRPQCRPCRHRRRPGCDSAPTPVRLRPRQPPRHRLVVRAWATRGRRGPGSPRWADDWAAGLNGRIYHDLLDVPAAADPPDLRLLPEFDALLCGYDPKARDRFVSPKHHRRLWSQDNGALLAPMLYEGRLSGYWRLAGAGSRRSCEVAWFAGTRRPRKSDLDGPVAALEAAYGVTVTGVSITRDP
jgi:DNA glycosylase AlkZ-like